MRNLYLLLVPIFCLFLSPTILAQSPLSADAGPDTMFVCHLDWLGPVGLQGAATGGVPPYTYLWEGVWNPGGALSWDATDFLDDVTSSEPWFFKRLSGGMFFYLTVTDSIGMISTDSIWVESCDNLQTAEVLIDFINQGDTSTLRTNGASTCGQASIQWHPNYNISDSTAANPKVWPEVTTFYSATIVDLAGCTLSGGTMEVVVYPTGISTVSADFIQLEVFPNPIRHGEALNVQGQTKNGMVWQWYDGLGRQGRREPLQQGQTIISTSGLAAGVHFYRVLHGGRVVHRGKVVLN